LAFPFVAGSTALAAAGGDVDARFDVLRFPAVEARFPDVVFAVAEARFFTLRVPRILGIGPVVSVTPSGVAGGVPGVMVNDPAAGDGTSPAETSLAPSRAQKLASDS
jgi:hypothetical protein